MLGRFRVIDRLLSTPRETIYRVFDPLSRGTDSGLEAGTCLLRHLGEAEMLDAVRPDEYRQRFGAARDLAPVADGPAAASTSTGDTGSGAIAGKVSFSGTAPPPRSREA